MAFSEKSIVPNFLYTSTSSRFLNRNTSNPSLFPAANSTNNFVIPAPNEPLGKIEMYSPQFYAACTVGGILSCGLTHMAVTPLDLVKCNMQVYHSLPFFLNFIHFIYVVIFLISVGFVM